MDEAEFARICALDAFPGADGDAPLSVGEEAFAAIKRQQRHRQLRGALRPLRNDKALRRLAARRAAGESLRAIAAAAGLAPCMLARLLLESELGWSKTAVSNVFKEAMADEEPAERSCRGLAPNEYARVLREVKECIEEDAYCSPLADRVRHNVGVEFEYRLLETLRNRRLVFESEDVLREKGLSKTPDVRLLLPIGVLDPATGRLRVVNWIDSKAMFGDRHTHETENAGQLQGYVNRYGPGMVIYWFGHIANLSNDSDVFITDRFPPEITLPGGFELTDAHVKPVEGDDAPLVELEAETGFDTQWTPITTAFLS